MNEASPRSEFACRDVIVMGASAGGLEPLQLVLAALPADLNAVVLVVLHVGATSYLSEILARRSALPVRQAISGEPIEFGRVYVAAPGLHLLVHDSHLLLRRGPRENHARPAIDPLFRSAAATFGARVIGVILSGVLNDGAAGMRAVKTCGGTAIVQHPTDARYPEMPLCALSYCEVDHVVPAAELSALLARLAHEPARTAPAIPLSVRLETAIAA
jgi:two-component system chemotaxis response regulator CheB